MSKLPFGSLVKSAVRRQLELLAIKRSFCRFHVDAVERSCILVLPGTGISLSACTCARERVQRPAAYVLSLLVCLDLSRVPEWIFASALSMYVYSHSLI
jgi:hypothetical protein